MSVEAVLVSSSETGILISEPTCPNTVPWTAFSFVVPDATTHCPSLTSSFVILPLGNFTSALEAPSDIVTGIVVAYEWTFFTVIVGFTTTVIYFWTSCPEWIHVESDFWVVL